MTLDTLRAHAASGVDFISVGALTHSAPVLDLSLLLVPGPTPRALTRVAERRSVGSVSMRHAPVA